jgi:hypothetical protein
MVEMVVKEQDIIAKGKDRTFSRWRRGITPV